MQKSMRPSFSLLYIFSLLLPLSVQPYPLSTNSRWIVDESGQRVKLACVNWPSHLDSMVAEGLGKQNVDAIAANIGSMGFNCVRFTWALFMATNDSMGSMTVRESFEGLGLEESARGIRANNPDFLEITVVDAFKRVVSSLGKQNMMVVLDNHISKPGWCCSPSDGSGFFGDEYFDPTVWIEGLRRMATMFNGTTNVIGMSLRNELRGPRQNVEDWYRYMQMGAETIHTANPNVLVILSGLRNDNDLSFLDGRQVNLTFTGKLVFEVHWYAFSDGNAWAESNPNQQCGRVSDNVKRKAGFLLDRGFPLFVSEWGIDERGGNVNDNRYLGCFLGLAAELDWDWAIWTLQGSYYIREGVLGSDEAYGLLTGDWHMIKNSTYLRMVATLQPPFIGPGVSNEPPYTIILHTLTGRCITGKGILGQLQLGPCNESVPWTYTEQTLAPIRTSNSCLRATAVGQPVRITSLCRDSASRWESVSDSKMHIASNLSTTSSGTADGVAVCLDIGGSDGETIVANPCKCMNGDRNCDPEIQWFKMVTTTRSITEKQY